MLISSHSSMAMDRLGMSATEQHCNPPVTDRPVAFPLWAALPASLRYALVQRMFKEYGNEAMRFVCREWMSASNSATHSVTLSNAHASRAQHNGTAADIAVLARHLPSLKRLKLEYDSKEAFNKEREALGHGVAELTQLQSLTVEFLKGPSYFQVCGIDDFDLQHLSSLRDLKEISIGCGLQRGSAAGLPALTGLTRMASTDEADVLFTDLRMPGLQSYRLNCTNTEPRCLSAGLDALGMLPSLRVLSLPGIQLLASSLQAFSQLSSLREVELVLAYQVHPHQLGHLAQLRNLQKVALRFTEPITAALLPALAKIPGGLALALAQLPDQWRDAMVASEQVDLRSLTRLTSLAGYYCAAQTPASLQGLTALQSLRTNGGLRTVVVGCPHLTELDASMWCDELVRPSGYLSALSTLVGLQRLVLRETVPLTAEEAAYVGCLTNLRSLTVEGGYKLTSEGVRPWTALTQLSELALENMEGLDEAGLDFVGSLLNLRTLLVRETPLMRISVAPVARLRNLRTCMLYHGLLPGEKKMLKRSLPKLVYFY